MKTPARRELARTSSEADEQPPPQRRRVHPPAPDAAPSHPSMAAQQATTGQESDREQVSDTDLRYDPEHYSSDEQRLYRWRQIKWSADEKRQAAEKANDHVKAERYARIHAEAASKERDLKQKEREWRSEKRSAVDHAQQWATLHITPSATTSSATVVPVPPVHTTPIQPPIPPTPSSPTRHARAPDASPFPAPPGSTTPRPPPIPPTASSPTRQARGPHAPSVDDIDPPYTSSGPLLLPPRKSAMPMAYTPDKSHEVRSLNGIWVPQPHFGEIEIRLRDNGRFGLEDHLYWPQLLSADRPHLALMPSRPTDDHPASILWHTPTLQEFARVNDHPEGAAFGCLSGSALSKLREALEWVSPLLTEYQAGAHAHLQDLDRCDATQVATADQLKHGRERVKTRLAELAQLQAKLGLAWDTLATPSTFAFCLLAWGHLHRCFAECWAWLQWQKALRAHPTECNHGIDGMGVVGAFSDDPRTAANLQRMGVPVWLVLPAKMGKGCGKDEWEAEMSLLKDAEDVVTTHQLVPAIARFAKVGSPHAEVLWQLSAGVFDFERLSVHRELSSRSEEGRVGNQGKPIRAVQTSAKPKAPPGGQERFLDAVHPLLPQRLARWQDGIESIDTSKAASADDRTGLWLPEAEFVVTVPNPRRMYVYVHNWLRFRLPLLRLLSGTELYPPVRGVAWRALIGRFPTLPPSASTTGRSDEGHSRGKSKGSAKSRASGAGQEDSKRRKEKEDALLHFNELLAPFLETGEKIGLETDMPDCVWWKGTPIPQADFLAKGPHPFANVLREITWELSEVAFRAELYALDRAIVGADGESREHAEVHRRKLIARLIGSKAALAEGLQLATPPTTLIPNMPADFQMGLHAPSVADRADSLDALRLLILRWPDHPEEFDKLVTLDGCVSAKELAEFEAAAIKHYCQRFYQWSGRNPVVPRVPPL